jgi:CRP-like cAMP-binding protein
VDEVIAFLATAAPDPPRPLRERDETVATEELARVATRRRAAAGETIVERWETTGDLFLVAGGEVDVTIDGSLVRTLRAGDVFGEVGALAWDGDYARPRSATVVARTDAELDVVDGDTLRLLLAERPHLEEHLRRLAGRRLRSAR